jgi:hypothetical protein
VVAKNLEVGGWSEEEGEKGGRGEGKGVKYIQPLQVFLPRKIQSSASFFLPTLL